MLKGTAVRRAFLQTVALSCFLRRARRPLFRATLLSCLPPHVASRCPTSPFDVEFLATWLSNHPCRKQLSSLFNESFPQPYVFAAILISLRIRFQFIVDVEAPSHAFKIFACKRLIVFGFGGIEVQKASLISESRPTIFPLVVIGLRNWSKSVSSQVNTLFFDGRRKVSNKHLPQSIKEALKYGFIPLSKVGRYEYADVEKQAGQVAGEPYFYPSDVVKLKSRDAWMTQLGRSIIDGMAPAKVLTITTKHGKKNQELFGEWQTELYQPPKFDRHAIASNKYGNVNIFTESMIPEESVWIRSAHVKELAKLLDIPCAEVCTGFTFRRGKAAPDLDGILIHESDYPSLERAQDKFIRLKERLIKKEFEELSRSNWRKIFNTLYIKQNLLDAKEDISSSSSFVKKKEHTTTAVDFEDL